ncbi:MAG: 16S rRNA (cytosine(967)-C(5))-methyltransferase RsmB [Xanthomonadales bacterium]|nr:16S rRNA (cytosine(967)-C(5))-methyltransferase RsmB [Xanthomonadales bacterium]
MSQARGAAARAVAAVLAGHALDKALEAQRLPPQQRAFAQALAYATVRHLGSGRSLLRRLLSAPDKPRPALLDALLLCGLTELLHLQRPPHAAVAETVAEARRLGLERQAGLVNALLRRFLREQDALLAALQEDEMARWEHPRWWIAALRQAWPEEAEMLLQADDQLPPLWLRLNRRHPAVAQIAQDCANEGLHCHTHPDLPDALRVEPPRPVERLPGFPEGAMSVQDAAAQRTVECLDLRPGQRILDACAAPGGKTAHLLEREPNLAQLVALDIDGQRLERVGENLQRLGLWTQAAAQVSLQTADGRDPAKWWDGRPFDRILLDAPCSGSGVVRRHPDIKWLRREADLSALARTQGQLLDALWPLLAEDGRLLYATCSVFPQENEGVIEAFLQRQSEACSVHVPAQPPRRLTRGAQRLTGEDGEDGFYYAVLQRRR